jgi:predicted extracellular nuclease
VDTNQSDTTTATDSAQSGSSLASINGLQAGLACHNSGEPAFLTLLEQVSVDGIVVVSPKFDAFTHESDDTKSLDGYYVADKDGGPNSGLLLTIARPLNSDFQIGDEINVQGEAMEYYCRTQLKAVQVTPVTTGQSVNVTDIDSADMTDPEKVELLEGSLVRITDAVIEEELDYGQYKLIGGAVIDDSPFLEYNMSLEVGSTIPALVGVVNYSYKTYTIAPRISDDVPGATVEPPPVATEKTVAEVQQEQAGLSCHEAGDDPQFVNLSSGFSMKNLVVTMAKFDAYTNESDASKSLDGYYVADVAGGPYSGVMMVVPRDLATDLSLGAIVDVKADATEFYCNTQIKAFELTPVSTEGDAPTGTVINASDLNEAATAEAHEGSLVVLENAVVAEGPNDYGEYILDSGAVIDDKYAGEGFEMNIGDTYTLTGVVHYAYGRYSLEPRSMDDVQLSTPSE